MTGILETIITSLQDILGGVIRSLPGLIAGLGILFLAPYGGRLSYKAARIDLLKDPVGLTLLCRLNIRIG